MTRRSPWPASPPLAGTPNDHRPSQGFLARVSTLIEWDAIDEKLAELPLNKATRPRYPANLMFRILLIQQWYGLSDPAAEQAVNDRQTFSRFAGLPDGSLCPSYSTIGRFRQSMERAGFTTVLMNMVIVQLEAKGMVVREGTMVEPSLRDESAWVGGARSERPPDPD